jgi:hypothetical protein
MTENLKRTTICLDSEDADVFRELSNKTKINMIDLFHEIAKEIKVMLEDGLPEDSRINFMAKHFLDKSAVVLYFSTMTCGTGLENLEQLLKEKSLNGKEVRFKEK